MMCGRIGIIESNAWVCVVCCVGVMVVVVVVVRLLLMVVEPERDSRVFAGGERWRDVNSNSNGERTEGKGPRRKGTDTERTKGGQTTGPELRKQSQGQPASQPAENTHAAARCLCCTVHPLWEDVSWRGNKRPDSLGCWLVQHMPMPALFCFLDRGWSVVKSYHPVTDEDERPAAGCG